jgi:hypothetical protein
VAAGGPHIRHRAWIAAGDRPLPLYGGNRAEARAAAPAEPRPQWRLLPLPTIPAALPPTPAADTCPPRGPFANAVCAHVRACVRACVCARACGSARVGVGVGVGVWMWAGGCAYLRAWAWVWVSVCACVCACV